MTAEAAEAPVERPVKRPKIVHAYCQRCATKRALCGHEAKSRVPGRTASPDRERCVVCLDLRVLPLQCPSCGARTAGKR